MVTPVLFVLGAGPGIGLSVAKAFATRGYKVALAARSLEDNVGKEGYLNLHLDLANPEDIAEAFTKVKERLGIPTVVVYNGAFQPHHDSSLKLPYIFSNHSISRSSISARSR
jgi:NAD(P)-dependent dehydrogenase (short-subunit alcohol dehydrogenase family)